MSERERGGGDIGDAFRMHNLPRPQVHTIAFSWNNRVVVHG
jgi:hypothetical protein